MATPAPVWQFTIAIDDHTFRYLSDAVVFELTKHACETDHDEHSHEWTFPEDKGKEVAEILQHLVRHHEPYQSWFGKASKKAVAS